MELGEKKFIQGQMSEKNSCKENPKKKIHSNQNYNSSRKVFQNAPNGIRACLEVNISMFKRQLDSKQKS